MKNLGKRFLSTILMLAMAISVLPGISVSASGDYMIFSAEFDGNDDTAYWANFVSGGGFRSKTVCGEVKDGYLQTTNSNTGSGCWGAKWEESPLSTKDDQGNYKSNVYFETKFKISAVPSGLHRICEFRGLAKANGATEAVFFRMSVQDGCFAHGHGGGVTKTDYALSAETWYTIKSRLSFADKKTYTTITDENGLSASFETDFLWSSSFEDIKSMSMHQNDAAGTTYITDYVRLYDMDKLGSVTVTYDGKNLENAANMPKEFVADITFENAVTAADMEQITVNKDASVEKVISEDGKTVMMLITGLEGRTKYTLNVPQLGGNMEKQISFITVDESYYLFRAEFDGNDDETKWNYFNQNGDKLFNGTGGRHGTVSNGVLTTPYTASLGCWGAYFGTGSDAIQVGATKENIYLELKFKILGAVANANIWNISGKRISGVDADSLDFAKAAVANGHLSLGNRVSATETDYSISTDTWYTMKSRISYKDKKVYTNITDESGNSASFTSGFTWDQGFENITFLSLHSNNTQGTTYVTDYVRLYDADLLPPVTVLYNGKDLSNQRISSNSFTANVTFPFDVTQADLNGITINNGASVSAVIGNDNKSATLSISSLADRGVYTLSIPAIGTNPAKEVKFIAANDSGYLFRAEFDGADDKSTWKVYTAQNAAKEVDFDSLTDEKSGKITLKHTDVGFGRMKIEFPDAIDVTGKDNVIWETKLSFKNAINENKRFMGINAYQAGHVEIGVANSKFYYGGVEGNGTDTGVVMEAGKEYILSVSIDFVKDEFALTIKDEENGIIFKGDKVQFGYGKGTDQIDYIDLPSLSDANTVTMDYVRVYNGYYDNIEEFHAEKPVFDKDTVVIGEPITATVDYESPDERDIALFVALYDGENNLTGVAGVETKTEVNAKDAIELTVTPQAGDVFVKAFCWDSLNSMNPLTEAASL